MGSTDMGATGIPRMGKAPGLKGAWYIDGSFNHFGFLDVRHALVAPTNSSGVSRSPLAGAVRLRVGSALNLANQSTGCRHRHNFTSRWLETRHLTLTAGQRP